MGDAKTGGEQPMKFTFLIPNTEINGGNRATFELTNALVDLGHEVEIFYPLIPGRDGQPWWKPRKTLVQLVKGARNCLFRQPWMSVKARLSAKWIFTDHMTLPEADFLVVSWWAHLDIVVHANPRCGTAIHYMRSLEFWGGPESEVERSYRHEMCRLTTSAALKQQFEARFDQIHAVVPDGVSQAFKPVQQPRSEGFTVGMMYRRQPLKRMSDGLKAIQTLQSQTSQTVNVVLFGERITGRDQSLVRSLHNCEHIEFPTGQHLVDVYGQLDVFLFPSGPEEAFGLPPLEAMACGVAVVTTAVGATPDYAVHNQSAMFCEVGDVDAMAEQMLHLMQDEHLRRSIADQGMIAASQHQWLDCGREFIKALPST